jgi:hypothetical protein
MKKDWRKLTTVLGLTLAWLVLAGCGESLPLRGDLSIR